MIFFNSDGSMREPFLIRVLHGEAKAEDIDDEIEAWHKTDESRETPTWQLRDPLSEWLGLTEDEYAKFVADAGSFKKLIEKRRAANDDRRRTNFDTPINPRMKEGRYQDTLRRFRERIASGLEFDLDDSEATGDKYTDAAWGLCSCKETKAYPDINDHTFPARIVDDMKSGYGVLLSPRDPPKEATCAFDRGRFKPDPLNPGHQGCFYRCMLFRPIKGTLPKGERVPRPPTREEALKLYDDLIAERERQFGRKTTADDGEDRWQPRGRVKGRAS